MIAAVYDRYMQLVPVGLGRCRFKGGGGTSTTIQKREIPAQTANEALLESQLMQQATDAMNMLNRSGGVKDKLNDAMNNVVDFDWQNLYDTFMRENSQSLSDYQRDSQRYLDAYNRSSQGALSDFASAAQNYLNGYTGRTDAATNSYATNQRNALNALQSALGNTNAQAVQAANAQAAARNAAQADYTKALQNADALAKGYTDEYRTYGQTLLDEMNRQAAAQNGAYDELLKGNLPSSYAAARQQALNADLKQTMGSAVANLANRGIVNSSVSNTALNDITRNASDTLARNFTSDLMTAADIIDRSRENSSSTYSTRSNLAKDLYGAGISYADRLGDTAGKVYSGNISNADTAYNSAMNSVNLGVNNAKDIYGSATGTNQSILSALKDAANSIYGSQTDYNNQLYQNRLNAANQLYQNQTGTASNIFTNRQLTNQNSLLGAIQAQSASYVPMMNYMDMASQLSAPASNLYNTMYSGRMGSGTVTTTTSNSGGGKGSTMGGIASGVGSIGSAIITCFTGDTLVTTPEGYKEICEIEPGDAVLSVHDGEIETKIVTEVLPPHKAQIINVYFDNGTVWHTTASQRYFDGKHFTYVECAETPAMVRGGKPSEIITYEYTGQEDWVYDFKVTGSAKDNVYFANDVAAEGFGD